MKLLNYLLLCAGLALCGCRENGMSSDEAIKREERAKGLPRTTLQIDQQRHDFGRIEEGAVVKHTYSVRNTGSNPLLIARVITTCGCTIPSIPQEAIAPGAAGDITLQFDSHNKEGHVEKSVMIISNAETDRIPLIFSAEVIEQ